jgi:D-tyrosyl-tRNA(Tyr) deacylase
MRAVIQRVEKSSVKVDDQIISRIGRGLLVLLGIDQQDLHRDAEYLAKKIANLRIFEDDNGKMNCSLLEVAGEMLVVSQFTLLGDCRKGRRPSFATAADPAKATELYEYFIEKMNDLEISVKTGCFGAMMQVSLVNDGPVTLIVESPR